MIMMAMMTIMIKIRVMIASTDMIEKYDRNDNEEGGCHLCTIVTWHCIALAEESKA